MNNSHVTCTIGGRVYASTYPVVDDGNWHHVQVVVTANQLNVTIDRVMSTVSVCVYYVLYKCLDAHSRYAKIV